MNKKMIKLSVLIFMILDIILPIAVRASTIRISGEDRYLTAIQVAETNWPNGAKDVVLVTGEGYADAVSASVLAKTINAPILLTGGYYLNPDTKSAIDKLKPENVYIIGGTGVINQSIRDKLKSDNYNLIELKGDNRYETNIAVAKKLMELGIKPDNVMLVGGEGFSDALSAAPIAAAKEQILLLGSNDNSTMKSVIDFVKSNNSKVTVIGTTNIINEYVYKDLGAIERINGGANRFETNLNVLNRFKDDLRSDKLFIASAAANAKDDGYADALVASSLAGKFSDPLVLVDKEGSAAISKVLEYVKGKANKSTELNVIGGKGVISDNVAAQISNAISESTNNVGNIKVSSVSTNGLNQIKVEFNTEVNKDTAESVENYQLDGVALNSENASATLQDDNKTVLITLASPYSQYKNVVVTVKNAVLDKDLNNTAPKYDKLVTFSDITIPQIDYVTVTGNNKLTVKFSVPIKVTMNDLAAMRINGQSVVNYGLNSSLSTLYEKCDIWADKAELYFNVSLPTGVNTFEIPKGIAGDKFYSAAGFILQETKISFSVDSVTSKPQIVKVVGDNSGVVYITFNRPMDKKTALINDYYRINGNSISSADISFDNGSNYAVVKIKGVKDILWIGANIISVASNVKDAYGNKIDDNTNVSFSIEEDNIKPQIIALTMLDSQTIRIKFNKNVNSIFATNKSNYKLFNSDGIEITSKINYAKPANGVPGDNVNVYDIKFTKDNALTGTKYKMIVTNIVDINIKPNVMEDYTAVFDGIDDIAPSVTKIVKKSDDKQKVVIFFSEAMDEASINNILSYSFMNGVGDYKKLPANVVITHNKDDSIVMIEFPSNYVLEDGTDENHVLKVGVENIKDKSGNIISGIAYSNYLSTNYTGGPSIVTNTVKLEYSDDNIKATIHLTLELDSLDINDFTVAGTTPDSGFISGKDVVLMFNSESIDRSNENYGKYKVDLIKAAGIRAELVILKSKTIQDTEGNGIDVANSSDLAGRYLIAGSDTVYNMLLAPKTNSDAWSIVANADGSATANIVFDENIDNSITGVYDDDFIFINERTGKKLDVQSVNVNKDSNTVVYNFRYGEIVHGDKVYIRANNISSNINIRGQKDNSGNYTVYNPSSYDLKIRIITAK